MLTTSNSTAYSPERWALFERENEGISKGQDTYGFYPIGEFIVRGKLPQDQPPAAPLASPAAAPAAAPEAAPAVAPADAKTRLVKLKEMLDSGLINQQEYDAKRKAIIDSL